MKKIKHYIIGLIVLAGFGACDDKMQEMNTNPLKLSTLSDEYLFTTAVHETFGNSDNMGSFHLRFASQYAHIYVTNSEMRAADDYLDFHTTNTYKEMFEIMYINSLRNINEVISFTAEGEMENSLRNAIAHVVAIINYAKATDQWGDIPYTEGAWGAKGILHPKYDKQEFIYRDMMDKLKWAVDVIKKGDPAKGYGSADPVYNNNLDNWARFANSLRLRLAMRARFVDAANSAKVIAECLANPLIESNDQNFMLKHQESENSALYNPWNDVRNHQNWKMSEKFTSWLKSTNDPRLKVFVATNPAGEYKGVPNGLNDQAFSQITWNDYSSPAPILYSKSLSQYELCAAEVCFLKAEAVLFKLAPGDAAQLYQQGIRLNMQLWKVSENEISNFISNQPEAKLSGSDENKFKQISTQFWISSVPNFTEAWSNIRRTGYPEIQQRTDNTVYAIGVTNGYLPKRFKYATTEYLNNANNVNKAVENQGKDAIDTPVWWDVKTN